MDRYLICQKLVNIYFVNNKIYIHFPNKKRLMRKAFVADSPEPIPQNQSLIDMTPSINNMQQIIFKYGLPTNCVLFKENDVSYLFFQDNDNNKYYGELYIFTYKDFRRAKSKIQNSKYLPEDKKKIIQILKEHQYIGVINIYDGYWHFIESKYKKFDSKYLNNWDILFESLLQDAGYKNIKKSFYH